MGRKNNRKLSAYSRKLSVNPQRLISKPNRLIEHSDLIPHRGEVWFADLGLHPGTCVQEGCRPVLIISNELNNTYSETVTVIPMTSKMKKSHLPTHVEIFPTEALMIEPSMVLAEQVTTIGKNALKNFIGRVEQKKMSDVESAVSIHLGLKSVESRNKSVITV